MKTCFKCFQSKPLDRFYKHAQMADGRLNKCIECTKRDAAMHRAQNLTAIREYDRQRASAPHRVELRKRVSKQWAMLWPVRRKAQYAVSNALRDGRLVRQPCFVCGEKADAHHPDYDAPLAVSWLCRPHHKQLHAEHRKAA